MDRDYGFLDGDYWKHFNDDPLMHVMINEQFENIRKAFLSLDENAKNILDCFIIKKLHLNNVEVNVDKYIKMLENRYFKFYGRY